MKKNGKTSKECGTQGSGRDTDFFNNLFDHAAGVQAGKAGLGLQHQTVRDHRNGHFLDLIGRDEIQAIKKARACAAFIKASDALGLAPSSTP